MKLLYICNEYNLKSGTGTVAWNLIREAVKGGHEVVVATEKSAQNEPVEGVSAVHTLLCSFRDNRIKPVRVMHDAMRLKKMVREVDVVHILVEQYLPLAAKLRHSSIFIHLHGTYSVVVFKRRLAKHYFKGLQHIAGVMSNSRYTAKIFREASGYRGPIRITPWGVDTAHFCPRREKARMRSALFVGQIKPRKGLVYILEAFGETASRFADLRLYVAGRVDFSEKYLAECKSVIERVGVGNKIKLLGRISDDDLVKYYQSVCVNVLSSVNVVEDFEGFGLVHLEANACGTPSIGSYGCGNEDVIVDGETGWLCPQRDPKAIARSLTHAFSIFGTDEYDHMSVTCRKHALKYTWSSCFEKVFRMYAAGQGEGEMNCDVAYGKTVDG